MAVHKVTAGTGRGKGTHLQLLEVQGALAHAVLAQGQVEVVGEAALGDLQPPAKGVQVVEQAEAQGAGRWGGRRGGDLGHLHDFDRRLRRGRYGGLHHGDDWGRGWRGGRE